MEAPAVGPEPLKGCKEEIERLRRALEGAEGMLDERQRTGVIVLDEGGGILVASNDLVAGVEGVLEYLERRRGCRAAHVRIT